MSDQMFAVLISSVVLRKRIWEYKGSIHNTPFSSLVKESNQSIWAWKGIRLTCPLVMVVCPMFWESVLSIAGEHPQSH